MSTSTLLANHSRFKAGWLLLLIAAGLMTVMHFALIFALDEPILFLGYTVFSFYAFLILYIPFRRGEKWAWYAAWLFPLGLALPAISEPDLAFYLILAGVCVLGLILTMRDFFSKA